MSSNQSAADPASQTCKVCGVPAASRCSRCVWAYYCGKEHQAADWEAHKKQCFPKDGAIFIVKGILLPVDAEEPRIVNVECKVSREIPDDDETILYHVDFKQFLGDGCHSRQYISTMGYGGPPLEKGHGISLFIRDNYLNDGSKLNRCIANVTDGSTPHTWAGPVLALKQESYYSGRYIDASMADMRAIVMHLKAYGRR
ncbi:hypothetical protein PLICRDRAFT_42722 [Plicaturopsis crispa FD-325 SS-3]|nr:hypothetical protein PLICRDRAFT_42722 [Plicaturopsis crispa FD-325 SS-3]